MKSRYWHRGVESQNSDFIDFRRIKGSRGLISKRFKWSKENLWQYQRTKYKFGDNKIRISQWSIKPKLEDFKSRKLNLETQNGTKRIQWIIKGKLWFRESKNSRVNR